MSNGAENQTGSQRIDNLIAPLAQLDRASVYGTEGYWFEPSGVYACPIFSTARPIKHGVFSTFDV